MQYCPYCSGEVAEFDPRFDMCDSCGKRLYKFRADVSRFPAAVGRESELREVMDCIGDDNLPKARSILEGMIEEKGDDDSDILALLGAIHMKEGEDGKALMEWKKAVEKLETFHNIDAYVCLFASTISDHIYYSEIEFIAFDYIKYIDRLGEVIYNRLNEPSTFVLYLTINRIYRYRMEELGISSDDPTFKDVVKKLFCRLVEYSRNYKALISLIEDMLMILGYNEETYVEDENLECHMFNLVRAYLLAYTAEMSDADLDRVMHYWNDDNCKQLVAEFDSIVTKAKGPSPLDIFKVRKDDVFDIAASVNAYVKKYLLLDTPDVPEQSS